MWPDHFTILRCGVAVLGCALALSACGSGEGGQADKPGYPTAEPTEVPAKDTTEVTEADFPEGEINEAGNFYVPVDVRQEARRLCDASQQTWPAKYAEHDQVTFDIPDTGEDYTCVRP